MNFISKLKDNNIDTYYDKEKETFHFTVTIDGKDKKLKIKKDKLENFFIDALVEIIHEKVG